MVDAVVRTWLMKLDGVVEITDVCRLLACFYAEDGLITTRDPALLQWTFTSLFVLFNGVGIKTNTKKTEVIIL